MGLWLESFYKCVLILFRGASPTAKLNLIILKYLRSFGTKTLGTKTLPVVTLQYSALFESHWSTHVFWFQFTGLRLLEAQSFFFNSWVWYKNVRYENVAHGNHLYGAFIWKFLQFVFILFCGASPTAKLNLIFLKFMKFWYENVRYENVAHGNHLL